MTELAPFKDEKNQRLPSSSEKLSARQTFMATRRAIAQLEAEGATDFDIFNALADLFYERGELEGSELMAEAAYKLFQKQ